jgi:hypothetical protein
MGYDISICRVDSEIPLEEWKAYVAQADDLRPVDRFEGTNPRTGAVMSLEAPDSAYWTGHPEGFEVPLMWGSGGRIPVKQPDEPTLARMREIATALGARVQGEEGEFYDEPRAEARRGGWFRRRRS